MSHQFTENLVLFGVKDKWLKIVTLKASVLEAFSPGDQGCYLRFLCDFWSEIFKFSQIYLTMKFSSTQNSLF